MTPVRIPQDDVSGGSLLARVLAAWLLVWLVAAPALAQPAAEESGFKSVSIPLIAEGLPDARDSAVTGYLFAPEGNGKVPAVVLIHGCNGYDWRLPRQPGWALAKAYAQRYVAHGYAALVLDSFAPRGVDNACGQPMRVAPMRRAWDALSAARWLGALPTVDRDRLVLQGDSHGGWTTLMTLQAGLWHLPEHFAAGIAFYPACYRVDGFSAPLLILIGDADDWTPAWRCRQMVDALHGGDVELKIFPGAYHAFDFPLPARTNRLGHFMRYDAAATTASWEAIDAFLAEHLR
ncbi:MAG TPA: dienelactone hydrolase family protein [Stellaceae bacterium]|nr:dienelactone hydrolase family protein [Stellaceae bacterium]